MRWRWARINTMEIDLKVGSLLVMGLYFTIYICVSAENAIEGGGGVVCDRL